MEKLLSSLTEEETDELTEKIHLKLLAEPSDEISDSVASRTRREETSEAMKGLIPASLGNRQKQFVIRETFGGNYLLTGDVGTKTSHPTKYRRANMDTQNIYYKLKAVIKTSAAEKQMVKETLGWQKRKNKPEVVYLTAKTVKKEH